MATAATMEMAPVLYDEQDVSEMLDRQGRDLKRRYNKETKVKLDDLMETIRSTKLAQVGGGVAGGLALEGVAQVADLSEPVDAVVSALVGAAAFAGAVYLDEHDQTSAGLLGGASAAMGRASAGGLRLLMDRLA